MGKARKHSRGGFAPDYMVEPDEFGYSRGFNNELEEAPATKRSRFCLNGDSYGVHKEVLSLSRMSRSERKNLVHKLKMELQQVRDLHKKIACISSDTVVLSPYSDIHSCSDGPKRSPQRTFAGTQGKKRLPVRNDKKRTKKGPSRNYEPGRVHAPTSSTVALVMKECQMLIDRLWSHKWGFAFRTPVDPVLLNIPDYFTVIKCPMDLGTIRSRLRKDEYASPLDFAADVRLTFSNSIAYNPPGNQYHKMAQDLNTYFEQRWKTVEKKIPVILPPVMPSTSSASLESDIPYEVAPPRKKAAAVNETTLRVEPAKLVMTIGEKKKLSEDLEGLEEEFPQNIIDLLREQSVCDGQSGEVEIEIDIETLSDEVLFMVRKFLDDYLREKKKSLEKSEPCEMEIVHVSGFSNSPQQPSKGDLQVDEDVDIVGGNDPPVSSHPPLKIEKDAACRNNECNSSSSSSSESGSSSSDSDSCSSSGSETNSIKASNRTSTEDKKEPGVGINRKDDDSNGEKIVVNDSLNELGQVERDVGEKSTAMDAVVVLPDEETAPPERQISPEKRYRAALLKNRFADTIMKAREKALTKGEKGDPEKLRLEREEFEKRLREEKVRLQAEAKAAEEARRKAEAEAVEKARRERGQEREAARQALQNMEKTVEINEGRRFMEDLEMLRATGTEGDQLPTFTEEMSPKFSQDMLGSFKMEGNCNPLEQLGLFMKMDEDEDEDDEEDQPQISRGELDDQSLDRKERQTLSPHEVEGEDQLVSGIKEPVSQKAQELGNQEDENVPVSPHKEEGEEQMEDVPVSPNEEGEDQFVSVNEGSEELVSQKAQENRRHEDGDLENRSHEDGELINQNEGNQQLENVLEQENDFVDMVEEEAETVDMREVETETVYKGEEETETVMSEVEAEAVDKGEEETETVMREVETEIVDKGEVETEVVDLKEVEAEIVDKGEQETLAVDNGEENTQVVDMVEDEAKVTDQGEEETEPVMREVETEIVDKGEVETEIVDKGEVETEVVDMKEVEAEIVEQETLVVDDGEENTQIVDMVEEEAKAVDNGEVEAEIVDNREHETEVLDKGGEEVIEVVGKGEKVNEEEID